MQSVYVRLIPVAMPSMRGSAAVFVAEIAGSNHAYCLDVRQTRIVACNFTSGSRGFHHGRGSFCFV
jgi:hypothetical protein